MTMTSRSRDIEELQSAVERVERIDLGDGGVPVPVARRPRAVQVRVMDPASSAAVPVEVHGRDLVPLGTALKGADDV